MNRGPLSIVLALMILLSATRTARAAAACVGQVTALAAGASTASGEDDDLAVIPGYDCGCLNNRFIQPASTPNHRTTVADGDYWTITAGPTACMLQDRVGLRYVVELLRHPGREFLALDLLRGVGRIEQEGAHFPPGALLWGDAGECLPLQMP